MCDMDTMMLSSLKDQKSEERLEKRR